MRRTRQQVNAAIAALSAREAAHDATQAVSTERSRQLLGRSALQQWHPSNCITAATARCGCGCQSLDALPAELSAYDQALDDALTR